VTDPIFAPYVPTYANRTPYITPAEFTSAGTGVNVSAIIPGGTAQANADALAQIIARASSMADDYCQQVIAATVDTVSGSYRVQQGVLKVSAPFTPVVSVNQVQVGREPSALETLTDLSNVWIDRKIITVPVQGVQFRGGYFARPDRLFAVIQYVNGWANTLTSDVAGRASTTIPVASTIGIAPGMQLTIYDTGQSEQVTVQSVTPTSIQTVQPLQFVHNTGVSVSALPGFVKQAVILITAAIIKTRGSDAIVMPKLGGQPAEKTSLATPGTGKSELDRAATLLQPIARTW
jgi:hypothetical protein